MLGSQGENLSTSFMFDFNGVKFLAWPDRPTECNKNVEKCLKSFSDNFPVLQDWGPQKLGAAI